MKEESEIENIAELELSRKQVLTKEQLDLIYHQISMRLKEERTARNLSFIKLYERTGLTTGHLHKIETGKCNVGLTSLIRLAVFYDMQLTEFIPFLGTMGCQKSNKEKKLARVISSLSENEVEAFTQMVQAYVQFRKMK